VLINILYYYMERKGTESSKNIIFVVGGPGGSGSSVISKRLSEYFNLRRVYGGQIFREVVKERFDEPFEDVFTDENKDLLLQIDREVDMRLLEEVKKGGVLVESKVFAGVATIKDIDCTVKIWLEASLHRRVLRHLEKKAFRSFNEKVEGYFKERSALRRRWKSDCRRYTDLYGIEYGKPALYNDIVLDSSGLNEEETFNLILKKIKDGGYLGK
jgi:CMP/dCMP kinase